MDKEDIGYTYAVEYYSATKRNEVMPSAATWMSPETLVLSEVSQAEKDKHHDTTCTWVLKDDILLYKREVDSQTRKQTYDYRRGLGEG